VSNRIYQHKTEGIVPVVKPPKLFSLAVEHHTSSDHLY